MISWSTPPQTNRLEIWELPSNVTSADITNAFYELLVRHEALRTTFGLTSEGIPYQRIAPAQLHGIPEYDLSRDPQRALEVMAEMRDSVIQPHGCRLYRVAIFMDGEARWIALALSHLVADGESMNILRRDLFRSLQGQVFAEVRRQPAEQALMESSAGYRPTLERAISCFEEAVQRAPSRLFPLLRNDVPPDSCLRARLRSTAVDSAVRALATQLGVTPPVIYSTVFVASLLTLLADPRYTIFINFHGRFDAALKDSVGCYFTRGLVGGPADDAVGFLGIDEERLGGDAQGNATVHVLLL